jgi:DNA-binding transcriptional LysR family regulator
MSDVVSLMRTFVRVVEAGSFSSVAQETGASQPTVSRQVAALEAHLGCLLFQRTTRSLTLTDDGRVFYGHATRSLETLSEAEGAVGKRQGKPSGTLRLACAVVFGRLHIIPRLARFMARYPDVSIDLVMNDGFSDLVEEGIDLSIRVGDVKDPNLVARKIGVTRRVLVATPGYLQSAGVPLTPQDLRTHSCIVYSKLATGTNWNFDTPNGPLAIPIQGRYKVNNTEGVRAAVLQGLGIGYVPVWHFVEREIEDGRLLALLPDWVAHAQPIHAVYPTRRYLAPKVRAMVDYLADELGLEPLFSSRALQAG